MKKVSRKSKPAGETRRKILKKSNPSPNWSQLKLDYIHSDHLTATGFLEEREVLQRGQKPNGTMARIILGWRKAKLEYLEAKYLEEAEFRAQQAMIESKYSYSNAAQKKIRIMNELDRRLSMAHLRRESGEFLISTKDLCMILERIKVELGESNAMSVAQPSQNYDLNQLLQYINDSDEPFDRKEYEAYVGKERLAQLPKIMVDGRLMK